MKAVLRVIVILLIIFAGCFVARDMYAQVAGERSLPNDRRAAEPSRRQVPARTARPYSPLPGRRPMADDQQSTMISYVIFAVFAGAILYLAYKGQKK